MLALKFYYKIKNLSNMKKLMLLAFIFCSLALNAQEELSLKELTIEYQKRLELHENQTVKFATILAKYQSDLKTKNLGKKEFNRKNKLRDLEFYELLTKEQFSKYKKIKIELEPNLKYRFN